MRKKVLVIINPASNKKKTADLIPHIRQILVGKRINFKLFVTNRPGDATQIAKKNKHRGFTDIISVGGDGTANEILNGIKKSRINLGMVCTGSGNDFGRNLIDHKAGLDEQLQVALFGQIKKIDVGICNKRYFLNGIGIGFDGKVVEEIMKKGKRFTGHWVYMSVVLKLLMTFKEPFMTVKAGKREIHERFFLITVANGRDFGGGFRLAPDARVDDGWFDVCSIKPMNVMGRYLNMPKVTKGEHKDLDVVEIYRTRKIYIKSEEDVVAHMDGEYIGQGPFKIRILPRFLNIRVYEKIFRV
ncbi:MAG: diacylglycerol kinase family lipid kinase [Spirochaetes bacterium]|nr:diacylglycerol kinase family lipid kinase [Spirochaetota bacterium]